MVMEQLWEGFSRWDGICLGGLLLCTILIIYFLQTLFRPIYKRKPSANGLVENDTKGISVVMAGQNQYENLKRNLPFWLNQTHAAFEVIVVYDYDDDDINLLLSNMEDPHSRLKCVQVNQTINFFDQEKFSLSIGLKSAAYSHVLLTHADCRPESDDCLQHIAALLDERTPVMAAYSLYPARQGSALARYLHNERILLNLGLIMAGKPGAASRHALIYNKELFLEHHGYTAFYTLNSGHYDVFSHYLAAPGEAGAIAAKAARLRYTSRVSFNQGLLEEKQYLNACRRSPGAARKAGTAYRLSLLGYHFFILLWVAYTLLTRFPDGPYCYAALGLFAICLLLKVLFQLIVHYKAYRHIGEGLLWWGAPCFEWIYVCLCPFWIFRRKKVRRPGHGKKHL